MTKETKTDTQAEIAGLVSEAKAFLRELALVDARWRIEGMRRALKQLSPGTAEHSERRRYLRELIQDLNATE